MTTKYFKNFGVKAYRFGDNEPPVLFDDLSQYVDVIDGLKGSISFATMHTIIAGDRPDTLSFKLYGTTDYYWTFFLMNDHIRESGWPIDTAEILGEIKERYPHRTVTSNDVLAVDFTVGTTVTGSVSGTVGTILKRDLDMGQLVIETVNDEAFSVGEFIQYTAQDGAFYRATLVAESEQYNAVHHYEDADGAHIDLPIYDFLNAPSGAKAVTYRDRVEDRNDKLKQIAVLKPSVVARVVIEFNNFHRNATGA
jgi:hypothetical protein